MGRGIILKKINTDNFKHCYLVEPFSGRKNFFITIDTTTKSLIYHLDEDAKEIIDKMFLLPSSSLPQMKEIDTSDAIRAMGLAYMASEKDEFPMQLSRVS